MPNEEMHHKARTEKLNSKPNFWLEDGSIIVCIGSDTFKLHRTLLDRHSNAFLVLQRVDEDSRMSDKTPTVRVPEETGVQSKDFVALLEHLYHDIPLNQNSTYPRIASILRVTSPKHLDFPAIHQLARERLEELFPSGPAPFTQLHPEEYVEEALELALEYDLKSLQTGLFYSLVITHNLEAEDSSLERPSSPSLRKLRPSTRQIAHHLLSSLLSHFTPLLFTPATGSHMPCTDAFADLWMPLVIQPSLNEDGGYRPLETLERIKGLDWEERGICGECAEEKRKEWTEVQEEVWAQVGDWLEEGKKAAGEK